MRVTIYIDDEIIKFIDEIRGLVPKSTFIVSLINHSLRTQYGYTIQHKKKIRL